MASYHSSKTELFHVSARGFITHFFADKDYSFYLDLLGEQATRHGCQVHAYCLMTNHVHLLVTPLEAGSIGAVMKPVGQHYVRYVNRTYGRTGTLWEGRFRSCVLQDDVYLWACSRYIELNPVRAGMVAHPILRTGVRFDSRMGWTVP